MVPIGGRQSGRLATTSRLKGLHRYLIGLSLALMLGAISWAQAHDAPAELSRQARPLFIPNLGQSDRAVAFEVQGPDGKLFFTPDEVVMVLPPSQTIAALDKQHVPAERAMAKPSVVRLQFVDSPGKAKVVGKSRQKTVVNYLRGNNPRHWYTQVPTYGEIVYQGVWDGIDLQYELSPGSLKGTFVVAPGADVSKLRWRYAGATSVSTTKTGEVRIAVPGDGSGRKSTSPHVLTETGLRVWQESKAGRQAVAARFKVGRDGVVALALGNYNPKQPLIVDPSLVYGSYLGGVAADASNGIAVDADGNAYVTGQTLSVDFPTATGLANAPGLYNDAYVAKFSPDGATLLYSTFLGGNSWDGGDTIRVAATGEVTLCGVTWSPDFPTVHALPGYDAMLGGGDVFITRLNASGTGLVFSTYLDGLSTDRCTGLVSTGNDIYVAGGTTSDDFPTAHSFDDDYNGAFDGFLGKLSWDPSASALALDFSTFIGGGADDCAFYRSCALAVDQNGSLYLTGDTASANFPVAHALPALDSYQGGAQPSFGGDAFVMKFDWDAANQALALIYSTYRGGDGFEEAYGMDVDTAGRVYVAGLTGLTVSTPFPITANAYQTVYGGGFADGFVSRLDWSGTTLTLGYSTYLGAAGREAILDLVLDASNQAYVTGFTDSDSFPLVNPFQATRGGGRDAFLARLTALGNGLVYSSYYGGAEDDVAYAVAQHSTDDAYIAGRTDSVALPISNPVDAVYNGGTDAFVAKFGTQNQILSLENSYGLPNKGVIRVLEIYAEIDYKPSCYPYPYDPAKAQAWANALNQDTSAWPRGDIPANAAPTYDPPRYDHELPANGTPTGYYTGYYHDASLGQYMVLGGRIF